MKNKIQKVVAWIILIAVVALVSVALVGAFVGLCRIEGLVVFELAGSLIAVVAVVSWAIFIICS